MPAPSAHTRSSADASRESPCRCWACTLLASTRTAAFSSLYLRVAARVAARVCVCVCTCTRSVFFASTHVAVCVYALKPECTAVNLVYFSVCVCVCARACKRVLASTSTHHYRSARLNTRTPSSTPTARRRCHCTQA
ncbi:hypothetical protein EON67_10565 [archaeon]|nr:MAG: hypothetical protein EON67_10565 [archaeon]